jgi:hypothetical protein
MVVLDVFIFPIQIAASIADTLPHHIHFIVNVLCRTPPLTLPLITTKQKKFWVMLCLVVNIAMKWKVQVKAVIFIIHILEVLLSDSVIYNIPPCIRIMIFPVGINSIS